MKGLFALAGSGVAALALAAAAPAMAQSQPAAAASTQHNSDYQAPPDSPYARVYHPDNLPSQSVMAEFPQSWHTIYYTSARNGAVPQSGKSGHGNRWTYAQARAWPLDRKPYAAEAIGIKLAETTTAQWAGGPVGVSVAKGMVFAASDDQFVYAINARTGKLVWRTSPTATTWMGQPIVHGNRVYVNAGTVAFTYGNTQKFAKTGSAVRGQGVAYNGLYALDLKTGKLIWRYNTDGEVMPTPAYHDGHLVISDGGGDITSVAADTGKVLWKKHVGGMGNMSSPAIAEGRVFAGKASPAYFYALDEKTGKVLWKTSIKGATNTSMGDVTPAVANGIVVTDVIVKVDPSKVEKNAKGEKKTMRQRVVAFDAATGKHLWTHTTDPGVKPPSFKGGVPMIHDGTVYVGSPVINAYEAFDLKTGKLKWTWHIHNPSEAGSGRGPAAWYKGYLYVATGPSLYKVDPANGKLLAEKKLGGRLGIDGPTIVDNTIYVSNTQDWIHAVPLSDLNKGNKD